MTAGEGAAPEQLRAAQASQEQLLQTVGKQYKSSKTESQSSSGPSCSSIKTLSWTHTHTGWPGKWCHFQIVLSFSTKIWGAPSWKRVFKNFTAWQENSTANPLRVRVSCRDVSTPQIRPWGNFPKTSGYENYITAIQTHPGLEGGELERHFM